MWPPAVRISHEWRESCSASRSSHRRSCWPRRPASRRRRKDRCPPIVLSSASTTESRRSRPRAGPNATGPYERAGGNSCVCPEVHSVLEQLLNAGLVHDQQNQVGLLYSGLETPTPFRHLHEDRRAPLIAAATAHHALAVFAGGNKRGFFQIRNHQRATCTCPGTPPVSHFELPAVRLPPP